MKEHEWTILRCYFGMMVHVHTEHRLGTVEAASESKSVSLNQ